MCAILHLIAEKCGLCVIVQYELTDDLCMHIYALASDCPNIFNSAVLFASLSACGTAASLRYISFYLPPSRKMPSMTAFYSLLFGDERLVPCFAMNFYLPLSHCAVCTDASAIDIALLFCLLAENRGLLQPFSGSLFSNELFR